MRDEIPENYFTTDEITIEANLLRERHWRYHVKKAGYYVLGTLVALWNGAILTFFKPTIYPVIMQETFFSAYPWTYPLQQATMFLVAIGCSGAAVYNWRKRIPTEEDDYTYKAVVSLTQKAQGGDD